MNRVLWLTENYPPDRGGMSQSCDRITDHLMRLGAAIDIAHFSRRATEWRIEQGQSGRRILCPIDEEPSHALNRMWSVLEREFADDPPSSVVAFGGSLPLLAGPIFAAWLRVPLITLLRGNDFDSAIFSSKRRDVLRDAVEHSACVCVVTTDHRAKLQALFPDARVELIPNGIDAETWRLDAADRERAARWRSDNVPAGRRVLGLIGELKQKKGGTFFLDALAGSGYADRFHVLIVGAMEPAIEQWLAANSNSISYSTVPFADRFELLPWFAACDVVVIPSFYDGFPNVLLEAASLGIPILASNTGGMADALADGESAMLFAAGDASDCALALHRAATAGDSALLELGARARTTVADRYDAMSEARSYYEILSRIAGQSHRVLRFSEGAP